MSTPTSCSIRSECAQIMKDKLYITLLNYIILVPIFFLLLAVIIKIHREKTKNNINSRRKVTSARTSGLLHLCNPCVSVLMGNRIIMGLNCLFLFVLQRFIFFSISGMANNNDFLTIRTSLYVILNNTGLKFVLFASTFILTTFMKNVKRLSKQFRDQLIVCPCLKSMEMIENSKLFTYKNVGNLLNVFIFISWCIYPGFVPSPRSYTFHYWFNFIYLCIFSFMTFIYGILIHSKVKVLLKDHNTNQKLILILMQSKCFVHIGFITFIYLVFKLYYEINIDNLNYSSTDELVALKGSYIVITDTFIAYIIYCMGRIFENTIQTTPFFICICLKKNVRAGILHDIRETTIDPSRRHEQNEIENDDGEIEVKTLYRV